MKVEHWPEIQKKKKPQGFCYTFPLIIFVKSPKSYVLQELATLVIKNINQFARIKPC